MVVPPLVTATLAMATAPSAKPERSTFAGPLAVKVWVTVAPSAALLKVTTAVAPLPRPLIATGVAAASALLIKPSASPKEKVGDATVRTSVP